MNQNQETTPPVLAGFSSSVLVSASQLKQIKAKNGTETGIAIAFLARPLIKADLSYVVEGETTKVTFGAQNEEVRFSQEAFDVLKGVAQGKVMIRLERPEAASIQGQQAKLRIVTNHPIFGFQVEDQPISIELFNYLQPQAVQLTALVYETDLKVTLEGKTEEIKGEILALPINLKPELMAHEGEQMNLIVVNVSIPKSIEDEVLLRSEAVQAQIQDQLALIFNLKSSDLFLQTELEGVELESIARDGWAAIEAKATQKAFVSA